MGPPVLPLVPSEPSRNWAGPLYGEGYYWLPTFIWKEGQGGAGGSRGADKHLIQCDSIPPSCFPSPQEVWEERYSIWLHPSTNLTCCSPSYLKMPWITAGPKTSGVPNSWIIITKTLIKEQSICKFTCKKKVAFIHTRGITVSVIQKCSTIFDKIQTTPFKFGLSRNALWHIVRKDVRLLIPQQQRWELSHCKVPTPFLVRDL